MKQGWRNWVYSA